MNDTAAKLPFPNSSFSRAMPGLQIAWDSTSLGALKKCPRFYQLSIVEGWQAPGENPHIIFGTVFHSATELYDKQRALGAEHDAAILASVRHALEATWDFDLGRPWTSDEPTKTRNTLIRTIVWYLDHFQHNSLETIILANGKPAVELSFRFDLDLSAPTGETYALCGHLDHGAVWNGGHWILDKKTSKYDLGDRYFQQYSPNNQISLYALAGLVVFADEIDGLIIDGIQVLVTGSRFRRQQIERSREQTEEWLQDLKFWLHQAETFAEAGYWPQNDVACGYGNNRCAFRSVCSADPSMRPELLKAMFIRRTWDPLQPR